MSINLLVVDDSSVMRKMVIRSLGMSGLSLGVVHQAENGREALDCLRRVWVDLVLTDIHMPEVSGIELVERMRGDPLLSAVPVVVVSTERSDARIEHLGRLGIRGYVSKPFRPEQLAALVCGVLGFKEQS